MGSNDFDAVIAGAGPAGMSAAIALAGRGKRTLLLDRNGIAGKKLRITGKGRCNVTNSCGVKELVDACPRGGKFLYGAFSRFGAQDTMDFFESLGVPLKTERGGRVFPVSDRAADIAEALINEAKRLGVVFKKGRVEEIELSDGAVCAVRTRDAQYRAPSVLLACGGKSYPATGSDGSGFALAEKLGHSVTPLLPSLVPLEARGSVCKALQGLSLKNCGLKIISTTGKKPVYEDFGEMLFTHFGLSGPTILSASAHMRPMEPGMFKAVIDLKPALDEKKLDVRLLRDFAENRNKQLLNSLGALLPQKLIPVLVDRSGIPGEKRVNELTREDRRKLLELLKAFEIEIEGFRPIEEAIVTSGGVELKEIDPRTMASKLINGLYFAGEMIDADAYTGGFNLQIAFSTGRLAGENM